MKTTIIISSAIALTIQAFCQATPAIPAVPVGSLDVNLGMVRQGVSPKLTWDIEYPNVIEEIITIDPEEEEVITKTRLRVQVSVIGVGITNSSGQEYAARSYLHYSSYGWKHIFTGTGNQVIPWIYYDDRIVEAGEVIRFAARVQLSGYPYYYNGSRNVKILLNGDTPPSNAAGYSHQTSAADYLQPYIENGKLALGPLDMIYCAELTHSNESHYGFDLQDTVLLVRYTKVD